ncbi:MAG: polymer-forming cytoskeletal protein [Campylobacter sp.]|nr:polymer-forming cytoskeletal protein [Campylobacter sp.]
MGFLNKDAKNGDYVSVISEECYFQGTLDLQGSVRVDGKLEGNVDNATYVTVSKSGFMKGNISAKGVVIIGTLEGDICADSVEILSTAKINGNVRSKKILIEGGAEVNASIKVVSKEEPENFDDEEKIEVEEPKNKEKKK